MSNTFSNFRIAGVAVVALVISACASTVKSTIDTAENVDLGEFRTYAWVSDKPMTSHSADAPELINPVNHSRIRADIDEELQSKGYVKVPLADADLAVSYTLGTRDHVRVRNYYDSFGYNYYGYYNGFSRFGRGFTRFGSGYGPGGVTTSVQTITEGTLAVDFFDNKRMEAIWHGAASKRISGSESSRKLVSDAVDTLLGEFPDSSKMAGMRHKMMGEDATS